MEDLQELSRACRDGEMDKIIALIEKLVPEYHLENDSGAKAAPGQYHSITKETAL